MDTGETVVFRPSRRKLFGMLLVSAVFVVGGVFMVRAGEWIGWLPIVFFGLGLAVFALRLLPNSSYLRVGPDGFTVCTGFRAHSFGWGDVADFKVGRVGTKDMVVFNYSRQYRGPRRLARLNVDVVGAEAVVAVAGTWNVRMDQLMDVLNRYRERYGAV